MRARQLAKGLYARLKEHSIADSAAQLSFYFLFSLFPFLGFLVTLTAYLPIQSPIGEGLERLSGMLPEQVLRVISRQVELVLTRPHPKLLAASVVVTLWSASRGVSAARRALNAAWQVKERRPYWRTELAALAITLVGTLLVLASLIVVVAGGAGGQWIAHRVHLGHVYHHAMAILRWPVAALAVMLAVSLAYWLLPCAPTRFRFITPGSVTSALVWLGATLALTTYSEYFASYNAAYGSIAGAALLLLWLYVSGLALILGAEIDALSLERPSPRRARRGATVRMA